MLRLVVVQILINCQSLLSMRVYVNSQMLKPIWKFCDAILDDGHLLGEEMSSPPIQRAITLVCKMKSQDLFEQ